ncbi:hypothetical protein BS50DRAFT_641741 [Corynespora cassiicola Philippines]|uniref:PKS/mFAS DH domain-containing protein n=1 Tax=Corynespora cassiicola Philippines TaxID=1448308 RepID=A0A2T2MZ59_CORCC|nr:hypothetical protein BS50DRAFT_641741 [Corynespora cassiicola Philippines]
MIKLRTLANSDAEEFELLSWNEGQQKWTQHCRALVTCYKQEGKALESADKTAVDWASAWDSARTGCHKGVSSSLLYQGSAKTGPRRTGMFRNVYNLRYGEGKTTAEVVVSDTGAVMPQHYESSFIIHPTTLDGILQCGGYVPFLDEEFAPVGGASNVWVPKAVDEVRLVVGSGEVQKPGQVLQTVGCVEQGTQRRGGTYKMDAVAEDARVHVRGLQLAVEESLALQWPEPHYRCYKQEWQACGELPAEKVQWHVLAGPGGDNTQTAAALNKVLGSKMVGLASSV